MQFFRIGEENGCKVYKKTIIPNIIFISAIVVLLFSIIFVSIYRHNSEIDRLELNRLMEQYRLESEVARARAEQYEGVIQDARETNTQLGESLSRSASTLSDLRDLLYEVRRRYEEMENLLNNIGYDNSSIYNINNRSSDITTD